MEKHNWLIIKIVKVTFELTASLFKILYRHVKYSAYSLIYTYKEHYGERKFGIDTCESYLYKDDLSLHKDGHPYYATPYYVIECMIAYLKLNSGDVFVDFGCGKGRVALLVSARQIEKVIAIELNPELAAIARKNSTLFKLSKTPITFINADAATCEVNEGTVFYMFNPFKETTLHTVLDNIKKSLSINPRAVRILCFKPLFSHVLDKQDWLTFEGEIGLTDVSVWRSK